VLILPEDDNDVDVEEPTFEAGTVFEFASSSRISSKFGVLTFCKKSKTSNAHIFFVLTKVKSPNSRVLL